MDRFFYLSIVGFILGCVFTYTAYRLALRFHAQAKSDFRRKNSRPIALLGGLGIFMTLLTTGFIFQVEGLTPLVLASIPLIIAGVIDDFIEYSAKVKLLMQVSAVGIWLAVVPVESTILTGSEWPAVLQYAFMGFWCIVIINALNMIDGMDLVASGFSAMACLFLSFVHPNPSMLVVVMGACLGFMIFNRPPAHIFLGESGSSFLGFFLATQALTVSLPTYQSWHLLVPMMLLAYPQMDLLLAVLRRKRSGTRITVGDHDHIHHKLQKIGLNPLQANIVIAAVASYSGITFLALALESEPRSALFISLISISGLLMILSALYLIERKRAQVLGFYSQNLLASHIPMVANIDFNPKAFQAVTYDLLPYYKELQNRGFGPLQDFLIDFSKFMKKHHPDGQSRLFGSYTLLVVDHSLTEQKKQYISEHLFSVLEQHNVRKNQDGYPWGVEFYSHLSPHKARFMQTLEQAASRESWPKKAAA